MSFVGMDERYARAALSRVVEPGHSERGAFEDLPPVELWAKIQGGEIQVEEWSDRVAVLDSDVEWPGGGAAAGVFAAGSGGADQLCRR